MTRELLFRLINQQLFSQLLLVELSFLLSWFIVLKLQLRIVEAQIEPKRILPWAVIGSLLNLFIRPCFPAIISFILQIVLLALFLRVQGKARLISGFWAIVLSQMTIIIGSYLTITILCYWDKDIRSFMLNSEYGMIIGTLVETMGPMLLLHILTVFKFSVTLPLSRKPTRYELIGVFAFGLMYFSVFNSLGNLFSTVRNNPKEIFQVLFPNLMTTVSSILGAFLIVVALLKQRSIDRQQHEIERQQHEYEQQKYQSERLVYEERIAQLERANQELIILNDQLAAYKIEPQDAIAAMQDMLKRLKDTIFSTIKQQKSYIVPDNNGNPIQIHLTRREKQVLKLIATAGKSNKEIAGALNLKEGYVKNIVIKLLKKTKSADRTQLAIFAITNNLIEDDTDSKKHNNQ
jgi:DNA-binding CsgD family transcriptional regulator